MTEQKGKMDNLTKWFIIFISLAFIIITLSIVLGRHSYEVKGLLKKGALASQQIQKNIGSADPQFQPYLEEMHKQISGKWQPPAVNKDSEVIVKFTVLKNGHVINSEIAKSSGNREVDESALNALKKASPLPPLPLSFTQEQITINFNFAVKANQY